jgi:hypothetical protein
MSLKKNVLSPSVENGTRMPRALACGMGLGGHVQRAAPGMSFVATCEHARGGPHAIGREPVVLPKC